MQIESTALFVPLLSAHKIKNGNVVLPIISQHQNKLITKRNWGKTQEKKKNKKNKKGEENVSYEKEYSE